MPVYNNDTSKITSYLLDNHERLCRSFLERMKNTEIYSGYPVNKKKELVFERYSIEEVLDKYLDVYYIRDIKHTINRILYSAKMSEKENRRKVFRRYRENLLTGFIRLLSDPCGANFIVSGNKKKVRTSSVAFYEVSKEDRKKMKIDYRCECGHNGKYSYDDWEMYNSDIKAKYVYNFYKDPYYLETNVNLNVCPNCGNTNFITVKKGKYPKSIHDERHVYDDTEENGKIKMTRNELIVGWHRNADKPFYQIGNDRRIVMNIKSGNTYYLKRSDSNNNYQVRYLKPNHGHIFFQNKQKAEFYRTFRKRVVKLPFLEDAFNKYKKTQAMTSNEFEKTFSREIANNVNGIVSNSHLIMASVLRSPELRDVYQLIYERFNDKSYIIKDIAKCYLKNYPDRKIPKSPVDIINHVTDEENSPIAVKDYLAGVISISNLKRYSELIKFFGVDNARHLMSVTDSFRNISSLNIERFSRMDYSYHTRNIIDMIIKAVFIEEDLINYTQKESILSFWDKMLDYFKDPTAIKNFFKTASNNLNERFDIFKMVNDINSYEDEENIDVDAFSLKNSEVKDVHDLITAKYNMLEKEINSAHYKENVYKKIKHLSFVDKDLQIVVPEDLNEIVNEGIKMNHCVGSYVDRLHPDGSIITFLRTKDNDRIATIEVNDKRIWQVKKKYNEKPEPEYLDFVAKWAKEKDLEYTGRSW